MYFKHFLLAVFIFLLACNNKTDTILQIFEKKNLEMIDEINQGMPMDYKVENTYYEKSTHNEMYLDFIEKADSQINQLITERNEISQENQDNFIKGILGDSNFLSSEKIKSELKFILSKKTILKKLIEENDQTPVFKFVYTLTMGMTPEDQITMEGFKYFDEDYNIIIKDFTF